MVLTCLKSVRWSMVAAVSLVAATASPVIEAQDAVVPSGRLVFRSSSLEFRPDGTFTAHTVLEGMAEVRATGTWKALPGTIELAGDQLLAGAEFLAAGRFRLAAVRSQANIGSKSATGSSVWP